jgi:hypothetical protein
MKKTLLSALAVGIAATSVAFAADPFDQGDKALAQGKKPLLLRVDRDGNQTLFRADDVSVAELNKLKGLEDSTREKEAFMANVIETVAVDKNALGDKARLSSTDQDKSTAANFGYYYGNYYVWYPSYPVYIYYPTVRYTYTYYYRWT